MDGCRPEAGEELCRCTIEQYQERFTIDEFIDYSANTPNIGSDPLAVEIIDFCLREGDVTTTTSGALAPPLSSLGSMEAVMNATVQDIDLFWSVEFPEVWGMEYETPTVNGSYFVSQGDVPTCGAPLDPSSYQGNAFYCGFEDTIQWDHEGLMAPLYEQYGDFTVSLVIAHEWGHAIQNRFGFDDSSSPTIISELQADCLAGAWTGHISGNQSEIMSLAPGDLEEAMAGFLLIGDQLGSVPEGPDAHGLSFDRLNAFFDGFESGAARCAQYESVDPDEVVISSSIGLDALFAGEEVDLPYNDTADLIIQTLEIFWGIVYPEVFGGEWTPVAQAIPYDPAGDVPSCGGFVPPADFYENNAFYCAAENFVAWDEANLFPALYEQIGDMAIGLVLANEWGRAVQTRAGRPTEGRDAQLEVDCLSGVFTAALTQGDERIPILLTAGDLEEAIAGFLALSGTPGVAEEASAFERFLAFKAGFFPPGIEACGL